MMFPQSHNNQQVDARSYGICGYVIHAVLSILIGGAAVAEQLVFVSLGKEQKIGIYALDEKSGTLSLSEKAAAPGSPGAMALSADKRHLYVSIKNNESIAAYEITPKGSLKLLGESQVGASASFLTAHPSGRFLLSSYYQAGKSGVHGIDDDGKLTAKPIQLIDTDERAHCMALDPTGRFAFVPHTRPNAIFQFKIDQESGKLSPNEPPKLIRETDVGPRHLWFHPKLPYAYGSDEKSCSITAYKFDPKRGTLSTLQTHTSLAPARGFPTKKSTSDIEVHPNGKFVYIANRGHDYLASFTIDQATGKLTTLQHVPSEATTRSFNIAPNGRHLIAAGQKSGKVAVFQIAADGKLTRTSTLEVGPAPAWVQIIAH